MLEMLFNALVCDRTLQMVARWPLRCSELPNGISRKLQVKLVI